MKKMIYFVMLLLLVGCGRNQTTTLRLMTHDSFTISETTLQQFESQYNITIEILPAGDAGAMLNQAILTREDPLADLLFGVDNSFMSRALAADLFIPYQSPELVHVPISLQLDNSYRLTPVDYGDVCLNYDKAWFAQNNLPVPQSLRELTDPMYRGLLVVQNPATSSPGLAFLLATLDVFGETGPYSYLDFWAELRANDVLVTNGWSEAYYGAFTVGGGGTRPLVVSYASSPPAEVYFAETPPAEAPTASVVAPGTCFRQVEFVGILQGTKNEILAQQFIDFMLSPVFQEDIPLNMFVFPANNQAVLPDLFTRWAQIPDEPVWGDAAAIEANREKWINAWTETVLR
ncbi:MAG: thiamine ABC transporter substrate-binding protein [Anaerolineae bacterium]|nr:thiamine ABC transporter substrate-binding protein [Anaerolineae bacterium]